MRNKLLSTSTIALLSATLATACRAPQSTHDGVPKTAISMEWIQSSERRALSALPSTHWRADSKLLISKLPGESEVGGFDLLDPVSGERKPAVNTERALASLEKELGEDTPTKLAWPSGWDRAGVRAVYIFQDDIYVLDTLASKFTRLTETEAEESSARIAPDGQMVAFIRDNDLFVVAVNGGAERQLTSGGTEDLLNGKLPWVYWEEIYGRSDAGYWWSPDSKSLAYMQSDESQVDLMHYVDHRTTVPTLIKQRYPKTGGVNPSVKLGVVPATGGDTRWIEVPGDWEYLVRVHWTPDASGLLLQTLSRDQERIQVLHARAANGPARPLFSETQSGWFNFGDDLRPLADGNFLWRSERSGYAHLYVVAPDGQVQRTLTSGEWACKASELGADWQDRAACAVDEAGGKVYFTAQNPSSLERQLFAAPLSGGEAVRLTKRKGTHRIGFSPNGQFYVDSHSALHELPSLSLHRADGSLAATLSEQRHDLLAKIDLELPELFEIPTSDGFPMPAKLLKPADFDPERRYPIILHVYGGPAAPMVQDRWDSRRNYFDQIMLRHGYLTMVVDNRSATGRSKATENSSLLDVMGDGELNDIQDAVAWIKDQSWADPDRLGIWGWSGGGTHTLLHMTRSDSFKAGISVAPVTDWKYYDTRYTEFSMRTPEANPDGYANTNLVERAADLSGRLLLVHGTYDDNVHPQNSWKFVDALIDANIQFEMLIYPMRKHGISDRAAQIHLFTSMEDFWLRNL